MNISLNDGVSLEEIGNYMQSLTDLYLYIDNTVRLYSVKNIEDIPYQKCKLIREQDGFLLEEEKTERLIQVFLPEVLEYLTNEVEVQEEIEDDEIQMSKEEFKNKLMEIYINSSENSFEDSYNDNLKESSEYLVETVFRIFMADSDDLSCFNAIHVNKETFTEIEKENDIDLNKTIVDSFTNFLKGYNVKVQIEFQDNIFAEMKIYTDKRLDDKIINDIDFSAKLNVNFKKFNNSIIFFILKSISQEDDIYALSIPLSRLPEDLQKMCLEKAKKGIEEFYYENSEMIIKNEGNGLYSLFDMDLKFYLSHLHPSLYYDKWDFNELPVAQFYLKN